METARRELVELPANEQKFESIMLRAHNRLHDWSMSNAAAASGSTDNLFVKALKNNGGQTALTKLREWEETLRNSKSEIVKNP